MKKKIPSVFANKVDKKIGNNSEVFYSGGNFNELDSVNMARGGSELGGYYRRDLVVDRNVSQKINDIFSSSSYIYKADVEIQLKSGKVNKRIVGKNSVYLITMDNELIPISDIVDIRRVE